MCVKCGVYNKVEGRSLCWACIMSWINRKQRAEYEA